MILFANKYHWAKAPKILGKMQDKEVSAGQEKSPGEPGLRFAVSTP